MVASRYFQYGLRSKCGECVAFAYFEMNLEGWEVDGREREDRRGFKSKIEVVCMRHVFDR